MSFLPLFTDGLDGKIEWWNSVCDEFPSSNMNLVVSVSHEWQWINSLCQDEFILVLQCLLWLRNLVLKWHSLPQLHKLPCTKPFSLVLSILFFLVSNVEVAKTLKKAENLMELKTYVSYMKDKSGINGWKQQRDQLLQVSAFQCMIIF